MTRPTSITPHTRLSLATTLISTTIPDEAVILDPRSGRYFGLDGAGVRVWELLQHSTTLAELVRTVAEEYDVDETACERDLRSLLDELLARGLVVAANADD